MKSLFQIFFTFAIAIAATELFWISSSPDQRVRWLRVLPAPGLETLVVTETTQPILPQLLNILANPVQQRVIATEKRVSPEQFRLTKHQSVPQNKNTNSLTRAHYSHVRQHCVKPPTQDITAVEKQSIYRWTDANGRVHFGDKAKSQRAEDMSKAYGRRTQGVKLNIQYMGWEGDRALSAELKKQASLMYRILTQYIPRHEWRQINLNLMIFPSQARFEHYKTEQGANAGWMAYYDGQNNQAYLARQANHEMTMRIARHEITHAMMVGMLGTTPIWISEGLAQYLERLDWHMSAALVKVDQSVFDRLASHNSGGFARVAELSHFEFNNIDQADNYHQSSAMMHFLLGHRAGQFWVKEVLGYFAINPCGPYDAERFFNQSYPGGIAGASQQYSQWLQAREYRTHYY
ncbi:MAG: DUF4124 domain-containing protein [Saccharospirillaceae bacterium]|nr:hypothetical protein A3759_09505 [Thalassolituus sp. HI0120]MCH2039537.1 DUF4124 domain-containing protein [Saccharospirillaceae bacterium]